jgi:hypothetical protein
MTLPTETTCDIGTLKTMKRREAAKALGRAYHNANPNMVTRGMETEDKLGWASTAFNLMGMAGGALGLGPSPNDNWVVNTVTMRNDAGIILVPNYINAKTDTSQSEKGRACNVPGLLLPGDETTYKYFKGKDETRSKSSLQFAVASVNLTKYRVLKLDIHLWLFHEAGSDQKGSERCCSVIEKVTIYNDAGTTGYTLAFTDHQSKNDNDQNRWPKWPEVELSYFQFTGNQDWPSFGIASLPTNVWYGETGINSLKILFTPHPDGI